MGSSDNAMLDWLGGFIKLVASFTLVFGIMLGVFYYFFNDKALEMKELVFSKFIGKEQVVKANKLDLKKKNFDVAGATIRYEKLLKDFKYKKAIEILTKVVAEDPKEAQHFNNLGYAYKRIREFEKAEDSYLRALELDQNNMQILNNLGMLYSEMNLKDDAIFLFEEIFSIYDDIPKEIYLNYAYVLESNGEYSSAKEYWRKFTKLSLPGDHLRKIVVDRIRLLESYVAKSEDHKI